MMTHDTEFLIQRIKAYFIEVYSHQLTDEEANSLNNILSSKGVASEFVIFALGSKGVPNSSPDDNFDAEKVFQAWYVLGEIAVSFKKNHLLQIFCKGILYPYLLNINKNNAFILSKIFRKKSKANLKYTQWLYSSFLGHSEFEVARSYNELDPQLSDRYYRRCVDHLMKVRELNSREDRFNYGMVGVSHYFIAKSLSGSERQQHLLNSIENLESAERLGDKTKDHFKYLGDALLEYATASNNSSELLKVLDKLLRAYKQEPQDTNTIISLAQCYLKIGISELNNSQDSGINHIKESIKYYDLLLKIFEGKRKYPDGAIYGRRGQGYLYLWYATKNDPKLLEQAIKDFQAADRDKHIDGISFHWRHSLANALIERYILAEDISDLLKAKMMNDQVHSEDPTNLDHLKQRGRIYLKWVSICTIEEVEEAFDVALKSFQNSLPSNDLEIQSYIGLTLAKRGIHFSREDDLREAIKWLEKEPEVSYHEKGIVGILSKVYRVLAVIIHQNKLEESLFLLDKSIEVLQKKISRMEPSSIQELAEYHGILGGIYQDHYKLSNLSEYIYQAIDHLQKAYNMGLVDGAFLGQFGYVCLQIGKKIDRKEEQRGYFEDAIKYLLLSEKEGNEDTSNYSEIGESYFRLYKINRDRETLNNALKNFQESYRKGNDSSENLGLIGDCFYYLSRFENSVENLFKALEYKEKARDAGHESKEHFSVVGRIHLLLYDELKIQDNFINGVKFICEAGIMDKKWPWPVCQLAEVIERFPENLQQLKLEGKFDEIYYPEDKIWKLFLGNHSEELWLEGAKLAANLPEEMKNILGGKSKVYNVEDMHGLISFTYVFKPGNKRLYDEGLQELREEEERTIEMIQYLKQLEIERFIVPSPVGIFSLGNTKIYAMRRIAGQNLSELIRYRSQYGKAAIMDTIKFLALYHGWHNVPQDEKGQVANKNRESTFNRLRNIITNTGLPASIANEIIDLTGPLFKIIVQLPLVEKKDAHADNWMVTNEGKIVMIDLEKPIPRSQFILSDLVQLIEDMQYFSWDREGWQTKKVLIKNYLEQYNKILELKSIPQISISPALQAASYLSLTILRALWGIGFAFGKEQRKRISSSSRLKWENRMDDYLNLISVVPGVWKEENISFTAPNWEELLALIDVVRRELFTLKQDELYTSLK